MMHVTDIKSTFVLSRGHGISRIMRIVMKKNTLLLLSLGYVVQHYVITTFSRPVAVYIQSSRGFKNIQTSYNFLDNVLG